MPHPALLAGGFNHAIVAIWVFGEAARSIGWNGPCDAIVAGRTEGSCGGRLMHITLIPYYSDGIDVILEQIADVL